MRRMAIAFSLALLPVRATAEINIVLKNDFIEKFKNHATITASFVVDKASPIHPAKDDADIHIAGSSSDIGLAAVAEIMNAKGEPQAVQAARAAEQSGDAVSVTGAWRLWCEHGGIGDQVQGTPPSTNGTSNPDHVFEIHPVSVFGGISVSRSLHPIQGYKPKDAHDAFVKYEGLKSVITPGADTTSIRTVMAGYNYVEFIMETIDDKDQQHVVDDGRTVFARVYDTDCELLLQKRRMVFVNDTPPEKKVRTLRAGKQLHVLGMPRIDLSLVSWRTKCAADVGQCAAEHPNLSKADLNEVLQWSLPYEIIVVGVYGEAACPAP